MDMRFIVEVSVLETVVLHSGIDAHKNNLPFLVSEKRVGRNLKGIEEANWPTDEDRPNAA